MKDTKLQKLVDQFKPQIDRKLEIFFADKIASASNINSDYKHLLATSARVSLRGGKRLRPMLAILGYQISAGTDTEKIINASVSLEIFHNYLLIHDDIMDRDDFRHGGLNVSGVYTKRLSKLIPENEAKHHAMSFAINAGDVLSGLCYESLIASGFEPSRILQAISLLSSTTFTVASGQQLDIIASFNNDLSLKRLISIAKLKTADYSIVMPLQFGAILAGTGSEKLDAMEKYGNSVGIAFQLTDDVLGMFGEKKTTGKPDISDLREGKQTVLMHYGMKFASSEEKKILKGAFGNQNASLKDLKNVRTILENSGAKAKVILMAQEYVDSAKSHIPTITNNQEHIEILHEFAEYCANRKK